MRRITLDLLAVVALIILIIITGILWLAVDPTTAFYVFTIVFGILTFLWTVFVRE